MRGTTPDWQVNWTVIAGGIYRDSTWNKDKMTGI
jgi:hypothetical protein